MLWECFARKKPKLIGYEHEGKAIIIPSLELTEKFLAASTN